MRVVQLDWDQARQKAFSQASLEDSVLVLQLQLPLSPADRESFQASLTPAEIRAMDRYVQQDDRLRFLAARGALRSVLRELYGPAIASRDFNYSKHGKPTLAPPPHPPPLHFNISHSGQLVLLALCLDRETGIDVEQIAPHQDLLDIARLVFADPIVARLQSLPDDQRLPAFYRQWTRHEAALKAIGTGFSGQIKEIASLGLHLHDLPAPKGYHAALAHRPR